MEKAEALPIRKLMDSKLRHLTRLAEQGDTLAAYALHQERVRLGLPILPDEIIPAQDTHFLDKYDLRYLYFFANGFGCVLEFVPAEYAFGHNTFLDVGNYFWSDSKKRGIEFSSVKTSKPYLNTFYFNSSQRLEDPVVQKHLLEIFLR